MAHGRRRLRLGPIGAAVISGWLTACGGSAAPPPLADDRAVPAATDEPVLPPEAAVGRSAESGEVAGAGGSAVDD
ncbi:MAG: hypothetical protein ACKOOG_15190, partial [Actinomycetota bacterium]